MNINKFVLTFLLLLQILFYLGYYYSNQLSLLFSFSFIFDEEFVVMFALFLVVSILIINVSENFQNIFNERIENLIKFFSNVFDQVLFQINNFVNILSKLLNATKFNKIILKIVSENIIIFLQRLEVKFNVNFLNFSKISLFKDKILNEFLNFFIK